MNDRHYGGERRKKESLNVTLYPQQEKVRKEEWQELRDSLEPDPLLIDADPDLHIYMDHLIRGKKMNFMDAIETAGIRIAKLRALVDKKYPDWPFVNSKEYEARDKMYYSLLLRMLAR